HRTRKWISRHVRYRFEDLTGSIPVADIVTIILAEIPQRSWIGRIHQVSLLVQIGCAGIPRVHLSNQAAPHRLLNQRALTTLEDRTRGNARYIINAEVLQLLRRFLGFLLKEAFLIEQGLRTIDRAIFITGFDF